MVSQPAGGNAQAAGLHFEDLPGVDGERHSLTTLAGERATVLVFISGGCPTARSYEDRLIGPPPAGTGRGSGWWRSIPTIRTYRHRTLLTR